MLTCLFKGENHLVNLGGNEVNDSSSRAANRAQAGPQFPAEQFATVPSYNW